MPREANRLFVGPLPSKERERVRSAMEGSGVEKFRDRCRAVLWSAGGKTTTEIAGLLHLHRTTVIRWLEDYRRFGLEELVVGKSPGRPRTVDAEAAAALRAALRRIPRAFGYPFTRWTTATLTEHLYREVHVRVHPETVRRAVKRMDFRYKRPKLSLKHRQDPAAVRRARRERDAALKKSPTIPTATPSSS
jgi:transposase